MAAYRTTKAATRDAKPPTAASPEIPTPNTQVTATRYDLRPNLSAVHPSDHMATMEDAAPAKSATPSGPDERPAARLRSANSTAERPAHSPKTPKAEAASASKPPIGETRPSVRAPCSEILSVPGHPLQGCYRIGRRP